MDKPEEPSELEKLKERVTKLEGDVAKLENQVKALARQIRHIEANTDPVMD